MDLLAQTANSLWQVVLVGLLLGAGLPAIFALGLELTVHRAHSRVPTDRRRRSASSEPPSASPSC